MGSSRARFVKLAFRIAHSFAGMRDNKGLSYVASLPPVRVCKACRSSYFHVVAVVEGLEERTRFGARRDGSVRRGLANLKLLKVPGRARGGVL